MQRTFANYSPVYQASVRAWIWQKTREMQQLLSPPAGNCLSSEIGNAKQFLQQMPPN